MTREEVVKYVKEEYGTSPEYPFKSYPRYAVLRHSDNKKWYGLIMNIPKSKLGLQGEEEIEIINLKLDPELTFALVNKEGYFPAYHMNKEHWISISLQDVESSELFQWIEDSFLITSKVKKAR